MNERFACRSVDWEKVRRRVRQEDWARETADCLRADFADFAAAWPGDPPLAPSDWLHYYFCETCGQKLRFDIASPHAHVCPQCGRAYGGPRLDGAWVSIVHSAIVSQLERAAVLAHLAADPAPYTACLRRYILFYAAHYDGYAVHGGHAGRGKVFPQCLTEAIFIIAVERVLRLTGDLKIFRPEELRQIGERLFAPAVSLLKPQISMIHNIHAWMLGALAAAADFLGDRELMDFTLHSPFGWYEQVRQGVTEDGLWYEISPSYHFYALQALLATVWAAGETGVDLTGEPKLRKMGQSAAALVYDDGTVPAYNDCWSGWRFDSTEGIYEQLAHLCPGEGFEAVLTRMTAGTEPGPCRLLHALPDEFPTRTCQAPRRSAAALLWGRELPEPSALRRPAGYLFARTGLAALQNQAVRVGLKCTPACGGHDHRDKLAVDLYAGGRLLSGDVGSQGYGIAFTNVWCRSSAAHNLAVLDGAPQQPCVGRITFCDGRQVTAQAGEAYAGVRLTRTLTLRPDGFADRLEMAGDRMHTVDWIFHGVGTVECRLPMRDAPRFTDGNGYDRITALRMAETDGDWQLCWRDGHTTLSLAMAGEKGTTVFTGVCPGRTACERLGIVIVRRRCVHTCFDGVFTVGTV